MCGRARCTLRPDDVPRACHRTSQPSRTMDLDRYRPAFNTSPGFYFPVVRRDDAATDTDAYAVHGMRWGLIPSFTNKSEKPDFYRMFNARSESIGEKASFRRLIPKNRCLVAVEGFYEWKKDGSKKQPYYIHFKDGRPLVFAALFDSWKNAEGETLYTFTIITTSSSKALNWLHDRMPVILGDKTASDAWLKGSTGKVDTLLRPYEDSDLVWYPVTPAMGKPSFEGPECTKEIAIKTPAKNPISKFFAKKETKEEIESQLKDSETDKPDETKLQKSVKQEQDTEHKFTTPAFLKTEELEMKPDVLGSQENEAKYTMKREHGDIQTSLKVSSDEKETILASPAKKRATTNSDGDKQPTLLSYFGRK